MKGLAGQYISLSRTAFLCAERLLYSYCAFLLTIFAACLLLQPRLPHTPSCSLPPPLDVASDDKSAKQKGHVCSWVPELLDLVPVFSL